MRYRYERHLHHHETDGDGVCHFSNYLRLFEESMTGLLRELALPLEVMDATLAVTSVRAAYHHPLRHGDVLSVLTGVTAVRRTYADFTADIQSGATLCCRVDVRLCAVTRGEGLATSLAEPLRAGLTRHLIETGEHRHETVL